jgi:hypothetical protein
MNANEPEEEPEEIDLSDLPDASEPFNPDMYPLFPSGKLSNYVGQKQ